MNDTPELQPYVDAYEKLSPQRLKEPDWFRVMRDEAMRSFLDKGFPKRGDEAWRYTDLSAVTGARFIVEPMTSRFVSGGVRFLKPSLKANFLFFINGQFQPHISGIPAGVRVIPLPEAGNDEGFRRAITRLFADEMDSLQSLNFGLGMDGVFIDVPDGAAPDCPFYVIHWSDAHGALCQPKILLAAGTDARVALVEDFRGAEGKMYFSNTFTGATLAKGAAVQYYKIQSESRASCHTAAMKALQEEGSDLLSVSLAIGGKIARHTLSVKFGGAGAAARVLGLSLGADRQVLDHVTGIDHASPGCKSDQLFKSILAGAARGVFTGKVLVRRGAQKTDAHQSSKNLLLSETAKADARPQLEILADDVKCAHGAAVGQLEEDPVFYLRSRGIGEKEARRILAAGFANEVTDAIPLESLRELAGVRTDEKLGEMEAEA
jgi:Fe-S cluster assembly protein SufD